MNNSKSLYNIHDIISERPFSDMHLSGVEVETSIYDMGESETSYDNIMR